MITAISQKIYETLRDDITLKSLLPSVKDGTNIWEMRVPKEAKNFPVIVFRIVSGTPLIGESALNAMNWFIEIDIVGNEGSMTKLLQIQERIYQILQDSDMSSGTEIAYKCSLDFFNTDYDPQTQTPFILTRWQIYSLEMPSSKLNDLG